MINTLLKTIYNNNVGQRKNKCIDDKNKTIHFFKLLILIFLDAKLVPNKCYAQSE